MNSPLTRIRQGALIFALTLLLAVFGYRISGCHLLDAIYMVVITVFGVGYGEMCPVRTPWMKVFTMGVIVAGTSSAVYIVGGFLQMVTEGEIQQALGVRRMAQGIGTLRGHTIICGFGRIGQILARRLTEANIPFVVIDNDAERIAIAETFGYLVKLGDASDEEVLRSVGIHHAQVLATVLPRDAINVFITLTARELNENLRILARGELPSTEKKLRLAGADRVILPSSISAQRMADMITHPATLDFLDQDDGRSSLNELLAQVDIQVDEVRILPQSSLVDVTIGDIEVRGQGTFIIVALQRADGTTLTHPKQDVRLQQGDTLIVMGHRGDLPKLVSRYLISSKRRWKNRER
ncbi:MAG: potassium channel protein [Alkalinema sp. RU_4_3]|nr:potassium channel protein [Alkalinema sp. RU_4_3]